MPSSSDAYPGTAFLPRENFDDLVRHLQKAGYQVIAPKVLDGAILLGEVQSPDEIARGRKDEQERGSYRLEETHPDLRFDHAVGMNNPRRFFFPPQQRLYEFHVEDSQFILDAGPPQVPRMAFLGLRPCDLAAMKVLDTALGCRDAGPPRCTTEETYNEARRNAVVVAINCTRPSKTCFCASIGTGPAATDGFDLALTELRSGYLVECGSETGARILGAIPVREPAPAELELAELKLQNAREHMGRRLTATRAGLDAAIESPHWDDVAERCFSCGNCTLVCPTCFCSTVSDSTDIETGRITRTRTWESCFNHQFTYTTAGPVRNTVRGRYRHWMRHKLACWVDQFGCGGCVGCGRCITWCPAGIDFTAEAGLLQGPELFSKEACP